MQKRNRIQHHFILLADNSARMMTSYFTSASYPYQLHFSTNSISTNSINISKGTKSANNSLALSRCLLALLDLHVDDTFIRTSEWCRKRNERRKPISAKQSEKVKFIPTKANHRIAPYRTDRPPHLMMGELRFPGKTSVNFLTRIKFSLWMARTWPSLFQSFVSWWPVGLAWWRCDWGDYPWCRYLEQVQQLSPNGVVKWWDKRLNKIRAKVTVDFHSPRQPVELTNSIRFNILLPFIYYAEVNGNY